MHWHKKEIQIVKGCTLYDVNGFCVYEYEKPLEARLLSKFSVLICGTLISKNTRGEVEEVITDKLTIIKNSLQAMVCEKRTEQTYDYITGILHGALLGVITSFAIWVVTYLLYELFIS